MIMACMLILESFIPPEPLTTLTTQQYDRLHAELDAISFFDRVPSATGMAVHQL